MRRPEIARLMTSCWISLVPSKIVWFKLSEFCGVRLVLCSAAEQASRAEPCFLVLPNPTGSGVKTRDDVHFRPLRSGDIPSGSQPR